MAITHQIDQKFDLPQPATPTQRHVQDQNMQRIGSIAEADGQYPATRYQSRQLVLGNSGWAHTAEQSIAVLRDHADFAVGLIVYVFETSGVSQIFNLINKTAS